ncbi:hypothetical protein PTTG_02389 [Puccinia triticina 1-1 BBBD Race 1]|uniref:Rho-GAP domain-containing protein n=1 Tax=Puccinia triticina (isolate 1-1 / race 1 (BBBD)) TaxID=630390 RepID=A0A180H396_PUCT1|nr:hypothetical protein PTTG_02389 [Puccinia triticina 1-1 BBBD Race 1]
MTGDDSPGPYPQCAGREAVDGGVVPPGRDRVYPLGPGTGSSAEHNTKHQQQQSHPPTNTMLKFRFPTTKRNTTTTTTEHNNNNNNNNNNDDDTTATTTPSPSPSPSNSSTHHQHQKSPEATTITDDDHSLPISLPPTNENLAPIPARKIRRKSYGGLRAMLGINKQDDQQPPPLPLPPPSACSTSFQHQQLVQQQQHLHRHHRNNPSLDASSSTSSLSHILPLPASPITPAENNRPSSSSLRPFPFLAGIRRKSANATNLKSPHPLTAHTTDHPPLPSPNQHSPAASSPILNINIKKDTLNPTITATDHSSRVYAHGSAKKAQSADDLSQFGLLPKQRIQPRRSEELIDQHRPSSPDHPDRFRRSDTLHTGLDQIGEIAGSLAAINGPSTTDDRLPPRLSNPKGMRTVYGVPLEDLYWRDGDSFPLLVDVLVELIEQKGLDQQGIYRVPGEKRVIENLQASIDERGVRGVDIWRDSYKDVHNLSGALKLFLREIPGGVIPFDRYDRFLAVNAVADDAERTSLLHSHVHELPLPNKILLFKLVKHFERVVERAEANSMLAHNVAIVFAPSLFRNGSEHSNPLLSMQNIGKASAIVRHFVLNAARIFEEPVLEVKKSPEKEEEAAAAAVPAENVWMATGRESSKHHSAAAHKRRSINMNLSTATLGSSAHLLHHSSKAEDAGAAAKRSSTSSVRTSRTSTTTTNTHYHPDELRKSRRGSSAVAAGKKKPPATANPAAASSANNSASNLNHLSKRSTTRSNSGLCGPANTHRAAKSQRHSLTGPVLSSSTSSIVLPAPSAPPRDHKQQPDYPAAKSLPGAPDQQAPEAARAALVVSAAHSNHSSSSPTAAAATAKAGTKTKTTAATTASAAKQAQARRGLGSPTTPPSLLHRFFPLPRSHRQEEEITPPVSPAGLSFSRRRRRARVRRLCAFLGSARSRLCGRVFLACLCGRGVRGFAASLAPRFFSPPHLLISS